MIMKRDQEELIDSTLVMQSMIMKRELLEVIDSILAWLMRVRMLRWVEVFIIWERV
jgi:hypothetical protein